MHMGHGLARLRARVEDHTVAAVRDALRNSYLVGMRNEVGQQTVADRRKLSEIRMMIARDHEDVDGSLRIDVAERDRSRLAGHNRRRYLGTRNTAEQALRHGGDLNVYRAGGAVHIYGCSANPRCTAPLVQRPRQLLASVAQG